MAVRYNCATKREGVEISRLVMKLSIPRNYPYLDLDDHLGPSVIIGFCFPGLTGIFD